MTRRSLVFLAALLLLGTGCGVESEEPAPDSEQVIEGVETRLEYALRGAAQSPVEVRELLARGGTVLSRRIAHLPGVKVSLFVRSEPVFRVTVPHGPGPEVDRVKRICEMRGGLEFRIVARDGDPVEGGRTLDLASERAKYEQNPGDYRLAGPDADYPAYAWFPYREADESDGVRLELLRIDRWSFGGGDLTDLTVRADPRTGRPVVAFGIVEQRRKAFESFTVANSRSALDRGRQLAIVLDGRIETAPILIEGLPNGGVISGRFSRGEAEDLRAVLAAGTLDAGLELMAQIVVRTES